MTVRRTIGAALLSTLLFALLARPAWMLSLLVRRECFRAADLAGLSDPGGSLGGQILGYNFQREPAWVHDAGAFLGGVAAFALIVPVCASLFLRASGLTRRTRCGACGAALTLENLRCRRCGNDLASPDHHATASRTSRLSPAIRRRIIAILVAAFVFAWCQHGDREHSITQRVVDLAMRNGAVFIFRSAEYFVGPHGPFVEEGSGPYWNFAYRHAAWVGTLALAGSASAAAGIALALAHPLLGRSRLMGSPGRHRGPTRCGSCRYDLRGLREPRCPECGLDLSAAPRPARNPRDDQAP